MMQTSQRWHFSKPMMFDFCVAVISTYCDAKTIVASQNFPNIDACIAFGFVFNSETACKYVGAKTLAQETQVSNRCLITLMTKDN